MKIKDLIRYLSGYNPDLEVMNYYPDVGCECGTGGCSPHFIYVNKVEKIRLRAQDMLYEFKYTPEDKDQNKDYVVLNLDKEDWLEERN